MLHPTVVPPVNFYPAALLKDLGFLLQFASDRFQPHHRWEADDPHPELEAFPRLAALLDHPHELTAFWTTALRQGLNPATAMRRDALCAHVHEFLQEVVDGLTAHRHAIGPEDARRAADAVLPLLNSTFHEAFDSHYALDLVGLDANDDSTMPGFNDTLNRAQQRRVLLEVLKVCVHHAQMHGSAC